MVLNKLPINDEEVAVGELTIQPSFAIQGEMKHSTYKSRSEGGYLKTIARFTREIETLNLTWDSLEDEDRDNLIEFFYSHDGPLTPFIYKTERWIFKLDTLREENLPVGVYNLSIDIEKIPTICPADRPVSSAVVRTLPMWQGEIIDVAPLTSRFAGIQGLRFQQFVNKLQGVMIPEGPSGTTEGWSVSETGEYLFKLMLTGGGVGFNIVELVKILPSGALSLQSAVVQKIQQTGMFISSQELSAGERVAFKFFGEPNLGFPSGRNSKLTIKKTR